jgi:hypothetical protein
MNDWSDVSLAHLSPPLSLTVLLLLSIDLIRGSTADAPPGRPQMQLKGNEEEKQKAEAGVTAEWSILKTRVRPYAVSHHTNHPSIHCITDNLSIQLVEHLPYHSAPILYGVANPESGSRWSCSVKESD